MSSAAVLRGTLDDMPIGDVLALVGRRQHSGIVVVDPGRPWWLMLAEGDIVLAGSSSPMTLGRRLLAEGHIGAEDLEALFGLVDGRAGERAAEGGRAGLGDAEVLSALMGVVPHDLLQGAVTDVAVAVMFEMMVVGAAEMTFTEAAPHPLAGSFRASTAEVVATAAAQVEAWRALLPRLGGDDARVRRVRRLPAARTPVALQAVEWAALCEIDDRATIGQIAHRLGLGRGAAYGLLAGLADRGLVEPVVSSAGPGAGT